MTFLAEELWAEITGLHYKFCVSYIYRWVVQNLFMQVDLLVALLRFCLFWRFFVFPRLKKKKKKKEEGGTYFAAARTFVDERERERERLRRVWVTPRGVGLLVSRSPRCVCSQAPPARWPKGLQQQQQRLPWTFSAAWSPSQLHSPLVTSKERYKPSLERKSFVFIFFLLIF